MNDLESIIGARLEKMSADGNALPMDILLLTGIYYELVRARHERTPMNLEVISNEPTPPTPSTPRRGPGPRDVRRKAT